MCALFGASEIVAIDLAEDKLELARSLGATAVVNAGRDDPLAAVAELTAGQGLDVAFEAFGSPATFATALGLVGDGGAVVVVGIAPRGATGELDLMRLPRRKLRILGAYGGRPRAHLPLLLDLVARGRLAPGLTVSARYGLEEADLAYRRLGEGTTVGRALIEMSLP
jgi:S-(hydroxymethyl)glutathione dehydrogenase/alcohol dehydrogenase